MNQRINDDLVTIALELLIKMGILIPPDKELTLSQQAPHSGISAAALRRLWKYDSNWMMSFFSEAIEDALPLWEVLTSAATAMQDARGKFWTRKVLAYVCERCDEPLSKMVDKSLGGSALPRAIPRFRTLLLTRGLQPKPIAKIICRIRTYTENVMECPLLSSCCHG